MTDRRCEFRVPFNGGDLVIFVGANQPLTVAHIERAIKYLEMALEGWEPLQAAVEPTVVHHLAGADDCDICRVAASR